MFPHGHLIFKLILFAEKSILDTSTVFDLVHCGHVKIALFSLLTKTDCGIYYLFPELSESFLWKSYDVIPAKAGIYVFDPHLLDSVSAGMTGLSRRNRLTLVFESKWGKI
jgi:hypothetical protein